jgi:predicted transcriptional regulator of viral defense system
MKTSGPGTTQAILKYLASKGEGHVFGIADVLRFGSRTSVDKCLSRLVMDGKLLRLSRGLYASPRNSNKYSKAPDFYTVLEAYIRLKNLKVANSEAAALNNLGLSTQVPARIVYLTDSRSRIFKYGNYKIKFTHRKPSLTEFKRTDLGDAVVAMNYLNKGLGSDDLDLIRKKVNDKQLLKLARTKMVPNHAQNLIMRNLSHVA